MWRKQPIKAIIFLSLFSFLIVAEESSWIGEAGNKLSSTKVGGQASQLTAPISDRTKNSVKGA